jgi:hypothetical protein
VPNQNCTTLQDARELGDDSHVISRMRKKAERSEEVEHCIESIRPATGHFPHVALPITERWTDASPSRDGEQIGRVVEPLDIEAGLGEKVRVASLPARNVEHT